MNKIWANRLIAGTKSWAEVPNNRKNAVKAILESRLENSKITEEQFMAIFS